MIKSITTLGVFGVIVGVLSAALGASAQPSAEPKPSRIIDRTVSCSLTLIGGLYKMDVSANTGLRVPGKPVWMYLAGAGAGSANGFGLAAFEAGNPAAPIQPGNRPYPPERVNFTAPPACRSASRIPLSNAGLVRKRPDVPPNLGSGTACYPGTHFVARVRAVFAKPTSLHVRRTPPNPHTYLSASGTVLHGYLAVRSARGKPLAYAEAFVNGTAKLFVARSCEQEP